MTDTKDLQARAEKAESELTQVRALLHRLRDAVLEDRAAHEEMGGVEACIMAGDYVENAEQVAERNLRSMVALDAAIEATQPPQAGHPPKPAGLTRAQVLREAADRWAVEGENWYKNPDKWLRALAEESEN